MNIVVTDEDIAPARRDVIAEIQDRHWAAYVEGEIATLAAITSEEFARWFWQPTALA